LAWLAFWEAQLMPQCQLPIFAEGVTNITLEIGYQLKDGKVFYFNGHLPVFSHEKADLQTFRLWTSQLIVNGNATQVEIVKAFGVPLVTVKRYVKLYRQKGPKGFYAVPPTRAASKLTPEVLGQVQALLDAGHNVPAAARELKLLPNTVHKAVRDGRLHASGKKK
jgi:hypothetical protein